MTTGGTFLSCPSRFYCVEYVIDPWMEGNVGRANPARAAVQWDRLRGEEAEVAASCPFGSGRSDWDQRGNGP